MAQRPRSTACPVLSMRYSADDRDKDMGPFGWRAEAAGCHAHGIEHGCPHGVSAGPVPNGKDVANDRIDRPVADNRTGGTPCPPAALELQRSSDVIDRAGGDGLIQRVASHLSRIEARAGGRVAHHGCECA